MGAWVTILTIQVSKGAAKSTLMGPGVDFSRFWLDFSTSWARFWGNMFDIWVIGSVQMVDLLRDQLFG